MYTYVANSSANLGEIIQALLVWVLLCEDVNKSKLNGVIIGEKRRVVKEGRERGAFHSVSASEYGGVEKLNQK